MRRSVLRGGELGCSLGNASLSVVLVLGALSGCGYSSVRQPGRPLLSVRAGASSLADPAVEAALVYGARTALADERALGEDAAPRLIVRVVAVEELSAGVVLRQGAPRGRGSRLLLRGEATLEGPGQPPQRFAASATEPVAPRADGAEELRSRDDALVDLARSLGRELARTALGKGGEAPGDTPGRGASGMWYGLAP